MMRAACLALLVWTSLATAGLAQELSPNEDARAQALMREIRCVACENEPISQSASQVAETMRTRVRTMVAEGASDAQVRAWFAERYGEFVLLRPKAQGPDGWLLWGAPFGLLLAGGGVAAWLVRSHAARSGPVDPVAREDI